MTADPGEKADRYGRLFADALAAAEVTPPDGSPLSTAAEEVIGMARAYLDDGRHFQADGDDVNALAAFSYGHGWLDAGVRIGLLSVPDDGDVFAV